MIGSGALGRIREQFRIPALLAGLMLASGAGAASIDAGRSLHVANCVGCHGTPPNGMEINNLVAANRPELIRQQIQTNPDMQFLAALTDDDLANIATYLAYPVTTDADCIFGWGETVLPALLAPERFPIQPMVITSATTPSPRCTWVSVHRLRMVFRISTISIPGRATGSLILAKTALT